MAIDWMKTQGHGASWNSTQIFSMEFLVNIKYKKYETLI